ncbi:MAG: hypothetical protein ACRDP8_26235 [Actinopolymorphaceae bacterium]
MRQRLGEESQALLWSLPDVLADLNAAVRTSVSGDVERRPRSRQPRPRQNRRRHLDQQLADDEAKAARQRDLSLTDDPYGARVHLRGKLDPVTTDMLRTALEPLAKPRPTTADGKPLRNSRLRT